MSNGGGEWCRETDGGEEWRQDRASGMCWEGEGEEERGLRC